MSSRKANGATHTRTIRVRGLARWNQPQALSAGLGWWHIRWHVRTAAGVRPMPAEPLGVYCWFDLDIHLSVPDHVRGYELLPAAPGEHDNLYVSREHFHWGDEAPGQMRLPLT